MESETRIDKWLWALRLFKTRTAAAAACRDGGVLIEGRRAKPSRTVRPGETISAKVAGIQRTVKVLGFPASRVGAKMVSKYMEDSTPELEYQKAREAAKPPPFAWPKGSGRPMKKNRRLWEKFGSDDPPG